MAGVVRVPLEGGGSVLVEAVTGGDGPVRAGRVGEVLGELPTSLKAALGPVAEAAQAMVAQLRRAGSDGVEVQFGVDLAVQAGAVITRGEAACHLRVTVRWDKDRDRRDVG
jgi:Trypsin-co-occurring domain 1